MRPFGRGERGSMLNRTDVRRECHRATFGKGEELQQKGAVRRLNWEKKKEDGFDVVQMDATVRGSGENLYEVKIKVDEDYREILEYECECPAFYSYSGMCKHCVAVLLTYLEERSSAKKWAAKPRLSAEQAGRLRLHGRMGGVPALDSTCCWSGTCSGTG